MSLSSRSIAPLAATALVSLVLSGSATASSGPDRALGTRDARPPRSAPETERKLWVAVVMPPASSTRLAARIPARKGTAGTVTIPLRLAELQG